MDKDMLEKFIADHKDELDLHQPSDLLKGRIGKELKRERNRLQGIRVNKSGYLKYAAAVVIAIAAFTLIYTEIRKPKPVIAVSDKAMPHVNDRLPLDQPNIQTPSAKEPPEEKHFIAVSEPEKGIMENGRQKEIEHYVQLIESKQAEIAGFIHSHPALDADFNADREVLNNSYAELKAQLKNTPQASTIIDAIVDNLEMQNLLLDKQIEAYQKANTD
ncbi:hypothetical protein [Pedobacter sp.]|uniref:hypothetical protein n=1 Tax=Pedobacter sp. TaxID=1411316 RepID=UPI00396C45F7